MAAVVADEVRTLASRTQQSIAIESITSQLNQQTQVIVNTLQDVMSWVKKVHNTQLNPMSSSTAFTPS